VEQADMSALAPCARRRGSLLEHIGVASFSQKPQILLQHSYTRRQPNQQIVEHVSIHKLITALDITLVRRRTADHEKLIEMGKQKGKVVVGNEVASDAATNGLAAGNGVHVMVLMLLVSVGCVESRWETTQQSSAH
jgi:hypothetical protein